MNPDLFVVGGGPAGLAVAIAARRKGFRVTVADSARPPIDKACGEGLMPGGLAALRRLGVAIETAGCHQFRGIRFLEGCVSVDADFPEGPALGMRRVMLHQLLIEHAASVGVRMLWGTCVEGISSEGVSIGGRTIPCRWIAGADGGNSRVRRWAGLDAAIREEHRFGFRQHYDMAPWTDCMEIYWGAGCQFYVTPVGPREVCVAVLSRNSCLRLANANREVPELAARPKGAMPTTGERGSVTSSRKLKNVYRGRTVLVGDASGSVDAITGAGLGLAFQHAEALAESLESGDLSRYQAEHRRLTRWPLFMADVMLAVGRRPRVRHCALCAMAAKPRIFARMVGMHVGACSPFDFAASGIALGWQMLKV